MANSRRCFAFGFSQRTVGGGTVGSGRSTTSGCNRAGARGLCIVGASTSTFCREVGVAGASAAPATVGNGRVQRRQGLADVREGAQVQLVVGRCHGPGSRVVAGTAAQARDHARQGRDHLLVDDRVVGGRCDGNIRDAALERGVAYRDLVFASYRISTQCHAIGPASDTSVVSNGGSRLPGSRALTNDGRVLACR